MSKRTKISKRPRKDVNQLAFDLVQRTLARFEGEDNQSQSTVNNSESKVEEEKDEIRKK